MPLTLLRHNEPLRRNEKKRYIHTHTYIHSLAANNFGTINGTPIPCSKEIIGVLCEKVFFWNLFYNQVPPPLQKYLKDEDKRNGQTR